MVGKRPKILVAPLDWGLGHATRCIPIIRQLLVQGCEVVIASEGYQKLLLKEEFPSLRVIDLPGYSIDYGKNRLSTIWKIILQIPKILIQINRENRWLRHFLAKEELDAVISDHRYGLYHPQLKTIFVCHQLLILTPFGKRMEQMIMYLHYRYIRRFSLCWVPDFAGEDSLAGRLSHPVKLPGIPVRYIGPLSRFAKSGEESDPGRLLILLSGPEPQRTILEKKILAALPAEHAGIVIVRGLPGQEGIPASSPGVEIYNHLGTVDLNSLICRSAMVIARSGYSTIMDLLSLQKKAILIPTPGQPEQEYLAQSLSQRKLIYAVGQDAFVLEEVLTGAFGFSFVKYNPLQTGLLEAAVKDWKTECLDQ